MVTKIRLDSQNFEHEVGQLIWLLGQTGCGVDLKDNVLTLEYDMASILRKSTRNAGRKPSAPPGSYTYGDILAMRKTMTCKKIADILGITLRTFHRRMKRHKESGDEHAIF